MSTVTDRVIFYASGNSGPEVRADGNGGVLARGWYATNGGNPVRICDPIRLTATQRIILKAAASGNGRVVFGRGDRRGTRVVGKDNLCTPIIFAYGAPEVFLLYRGLLARTDNHHCYRITDLGRAIIRKAMPS